jgi:hypothetical protein
MDMNLVNKVLQKLKFSKNEKNKKHAPHSSMKKELRKIQTFLKVD